MNDEAPDLSSWVQEKYGSAPAYAQASNYGHLFYSRLFELILRCRGNFLWPAMWNNAFNEDDPQNAPLADLYGVVMGTSHQEPMLRAQKEWDRLPLAERGGPWNWENVTQRPFLEDFWKEGVQRNKAYESIYTMGLRAENDAGSPIGKNATEAIVSVQRQILADVMQVGQRFLMIEMDPSILIVCWLISFINSFTRLTGLYSATSRLCRSSGACTKK